MRIILLFIEILKITYQAKSILLWAMEHGGPPEKWAATQCLALSGVITDKIIVELVNHLHADNAVRTEKAGTLLAKLSQQSVSFQSIIGVKTFSCETSNSVG